MPVKVTARHLEVTEGLQDYARRKGEALMTDFPRVESVHMILDAEKHRQIAEVVIQAKNKIRTEAKEESENLKASIDAAVEKVERQLRKLRDKVQDHKPAMRHEELSRERSL